MHTPNIRFLWKELEKHTPNIKISSRIPWESSKLISQKKSYIHLKPEYRSVQRIASRKPAPTKFILHRLKKTLNWEMGDSGISKWKKRTKPPMKVPKLQNLYDTNSARLEILLQWHQNTSWKWQINSIKEEGKSLHGKSHIHWENWRNLILKKKRTYVKKPPNLF